MSGLSEVLVGTLESSNGLVSVPQASILTVFTEQGVIDPLLSRIAEEARKLQADPATAKGREDIASMAYKVARTKTYLDGLGKDLVADMKELPKKVDASRKAMRDFLDALKDEVRQPLDQWEAEQARVEAERKAQEEAEAQAKEIEFTHEIALLLNADYDRKKVEAAQAAEKARLDREEQLRREGEERAKKEADDKAKAKQEAAKRREAEAKLAQERAEREQALAEQRAKDAEAAAARAQKESEERAEQAAIEATQRERARQEAALKAEAEAREAKERDVEHRRRVNNEIVQALLDAKIHGVTESVAKEMVKAIAQGKVAHLAISYWEAAA